MRFLLAQRWLRLAVPGSVLLGLSSCLGPNPGFFISTGVANATIMNLVQRVLNAVLAP